MAKEKVTLYIDDSSLRVLVIQDQQIKDWAEVPLEPELVKNNVVINETEVSAKIKDIHERIEKVKDGYVRRDDLTNHLKHLEDGLTRVEDQGKNTHNLLMRVLSRKLEDPD